MGCGEHHVGGEGYVVFCLPVGAPSFFGGGGVVGVGGYDHVASGMAD